MSRFLFVDVETRSFADLPKCGAWRYSEHETTDCLCIACALDGAPVDVDKPQAAVSFRKKPAPDIIFVARNAPFEYAIFKNVLIPRYGFHADYADPSRWLCTAALSRMHGLPASLESSADYINKKWKKLPDGKRLIGLYSIPATNRKTGERYFREIPPDDWKRMLEYNVIDVESDREAFATLRKLPNFAVEEAAYRHDFCMNINGVRIDTAGLSKLVGVIERATERALNDQRKYSVTWKDKNGEEYTGPLNVRSVPKLKSWLLSKGFDIDDTRIETLEAVYDARGAVTRYREEKTRVKYYILGEGFTEYTAATGLPATAGADEVGQPWETPEFIKWRNKQTKYAHYSVIPKRVPYTVALSQRDINEIQEVLSFRFFLAKASLKKYRAAADRVSPDGRLRYFLKYFGAHTGRFAGEGFQVHNLPKSKWEKGVKPDKEIAKLIKSIDDNTGYKELVELGKKILPGLMIPDKGNVFLSGDFAAVEARGIAWLAGCKKMLTAFVSGADLYADTAKRINPTHPDRQLGKRVILGAGYGIGVDKFHAVCIKAGENMPRELAERAVTAYREGYPEIPRFWYALEDAFRATWASRQARSVGVLRFERGGNYIRVKLPSGRFLYYHQVKIDADGQLSYMNFGKKGARVNIWGGVLAENITQAVCRDILTDRMQELEGHGLSASLPVRLHVHDEIVVEVPTKSAKTKQKTFDKILNTAPEWAQGFPLKTESEITERYHK